VAALVAAGGVSVTLARSTEAAGGRHDLTHVQFTDALFGPDVASAADAFVTWSLTAPRPVVVTLHDVPDGDDETDRSARRRCAYGRVVGASDAVVVSTEHEASSARRLGCPTPVVVPLPVEVLGPPGPAPAWAGRRTVGVLGFVYPGKGHAEAIDAVARHAGAVAVVAVGAVSPGHGPLLRALREQADGFGVSCSSPDPSATPTSMRRRWR
jgi:glycosyltransferase involved in cell wall biosynthesis